MTNAVIFRYMDSFMMEAVVVVMIVTEKVSGVMVMVEVTVLVKRLLTNIATYRKLKYISFT